jgi:ABC-2 type transport system ATP-binding protein
MKGIEYLKFVAELNEMKDFTRMNELIEFFELDPKGKIKKMSKGMKQKIGIVSAFMTNPDVLILDEPTSGLDPLMQSKFVDLIAKEKADGKTILMSSHSFEEVERTCDRVGIIKQGKLVTIEEISDLKTSRRKTYIIHFATTEQAEKFNNESFEIIESNDKSVTVSIIGSVSPLIKVLSGYDVSSLDVKSQSLEDIFMQFYGGDKNDK